MEHKKVLAALSAILFAACAIVGVNLYFTYRSVYYLPEDTVDELCEILEKDNIQIDRDIVSTKIEKSTVYVCNSDEYSKNVSEALCGTKIKNAYAVPDGELLIMENGKKFEFYNNFSFKFAENTDISVHYGAENIGMAEIVYDKTEYEKAEKIAADFLDKGSRKFERTGLVNSKTTADSIYKDGSKYYVICSRTINDVAVTGNMVICTVEDGRVTEAGGTWCFLTVGESYSAQLSDMINILFSVKKELSHSKDKENGIRISSVDFCYSLYFFGDADDFCLIPCWQIRIDNGEKLIYNAIDGTLYTKTTE